MRPILILPFLLAAPALAAPRCALRGSVQAPPAEQVGVSPPSAGGAAASAPQTVPRPVVPTVLPDDLATLPFAQHVAASGPTIIDLGMSHGLRSFAARSGDQFVIFQVTPDGQAAVWGALTDLTVPQLTTIAGGTVTDLGVQHGLPGLYVRSGSHFQVFYATPDKERVIPGLMFDATGKDITRQQVSSIPGAIPTVEVTDQAGPPRAVAGGRPADALGLPEVPANAVAGSLALVQQANAGSIGPASAPRLWMLVDPQCVYSVRAYQALRPYVASGRVQISIVPLSVLDNEDKGLSTKAALSLLSQPADQVASSWQAGSVTDSPAPDATEKLRANMAIANAIHLQGTPTFVWRKPDGSEGRIDGMPTSVEALVASVGG